jgi:hypothetical protein
MSFQRQLSKAVFCLGLGLAALGGAPMCPEEIEELMHSMNRPKIAHVLPDDRETGDDLIRKLLNPE